MTRFHANVILSMSWMNNTNTFIYLLLYAQHRSQLGPRRIRFDMSSWWKGIKAWFSHSDTRGRNNLTARTGV